MASARSYDHLVADMRTPISKLELIKWFACRAAAYAAAGEHTEIVLCELGYSDEDIEGLARSRTVKVANTDSCWARDLES